jgi:hypothetical protein
MKSANKTNLVIDHKIKPWPSNFSQQSESQIKKEMKINRLKQACKSLR